MSSKSAARKAGNTTLQSLVDRYHLGEMERTRIKKACEELAGCEVVLKDEGTRKNWIQVIVREGLEPLLKLAGDASFQIMGPTGLFNDLGVCCRRDKYLSIRVRLPQGQELGRVSFHDPRKSAARFRNGTIGEVNNGNAVYRAFPKGFTVAHLIVLVRSRKAFRAFLKEYFHVRTPSANRAWLESIKQAGT